MKTKNLFLLLACALFISCENQAIVQVKNNVHNVRLDNISFSNVSIGSGVFPGETVEKTITDNYKEISFPVTSQLEFYMVKGDKRVYLKTKEFFKVDEDETLEISITDDTELINPMN
ncbi:hypothetical protein FACS189421_01460 [Bacteroidia bacterium]|nr:hypothetical protein FACS189421_01460 [Bacteroidia bacterium]GHT46039.1 hypothetical protein FACS189440_03210 [Bacteroidia bacterium]